MLSFSILINKECRLPSGYIPEHLAVPAIPFDAHPDDPKRLLCKEAAHAVESLFERAKNDHISLFGISGYRPYERQELLYQDALKRAKRDGIPDEDIKSALLVAPPGASEHQTGLALDVSCPSIALDLIEEFANTREGKWLKVYAPLHGFILRYPKGKDSITGYAYEPWHIRYVTKSLALYLSLTGLTLEEYHQI